MGLDIYAGTLTRYYAGNWKSVVQQWSEAQGIAYQKITPDGQEVDKENELTPEEILESIQDWRDQIIKGISSQGRVYRAWMESHEAPYYTDKPDWDALEAMLLVAACLTYGRRVPKTIAKDWDFLEDPMIQKLRNDPTRTWSLFRNVAVWLPVPDPFIFLAPLPTGDEAMMGTLAGLRKELERINELAWQASEERILSWSQKEGYPVDMRINARGKVCAQEECTRFDTESLAKFAYSIFWQALCFAEKEKVPVVLDF